MPPRSRKQFGEHVGTHTTTAIYLCNMCPKPFLGTSSDSFQPNSFSGNGQLEKIYVQSPYGGSFCSGTDVTT